MIDYKIDRAHQRRGLASQFLQAADSTCRAHLGQFGRMKVQVLDYNVAAIQLYEKRGFNRRVCSPAAVDMLNLGESLACHDQFFMSSRPPT